MVLPDPLGIIVITRTDVEQRPEMLSQLGSYITQSAPLRFDFNIILLSLIYDVYNAK